MTRFTDGKKTIEISMRVWGGTQYGPAWERDFFDVGGLPYDDEADAYKVDDVDYLVDQANDWRDGVGDYQDDEEGQPGHTPDDRAVFVDEIE